MEKGNQVAGKSRGDRERGGRKTWIADALSKGLPVAQERQKEKGG